jgi:hypothetical protein
MCRMIREYFEQTGYAIGFKPAGGIRTAKTALEFLYLMKESSATGGSGTTSSASARAPADRHRAQLEHFRHQPLRRGPPPPDALTAMATTVAEIFKTMEYGPAPESDKEALAWLAKHDKPSATTSAGAGPGRQDLRRHQPRDREAIGE